MNALHWNDEINLELLHSILENALYIVGLLLEMPDVSESLCEWAVIEILTQYFCDLSFFK
jgi:hypothetical protein